MSEISKERAELEYAVIGAMIHDAATAGKLLPIVSSEDFGTEFLRTVYFAVKSLFQRSVPIDRLTVTQECGSDEYGRIVQAALDYRAMPANAEAYAVMLRDRARRDEVSRLASDLSLAETPEDEAEILGKINGLMVTKRQFKAVTASDAMDSFYDRHSAQKTPEFLDYGFRKLNAAVFSELGDLIILAGEPSSGKTALAAQMAATLARKHRVGFFTLETSSEKLTDRIVAQFSRIPLEQIKKNILREKEWKQIAEVGEQIGQLHLEQIPAAGMTVSDIRSFSLAHNYDVIFIDYLQIIRPASSRASRYEQVTQISMELHTMSQENHIAVVALAQLSRPEKTKGKTPSPPGMHDLKESGQIEQDADAILLLFRKDREDNTCPRRLKVGKNKEGEITEFELDFDGPTQIFTEAKTWTPVRTAPKKEEPPMFRELGKEEGGPLPF